MSRWTGAVGVWLAACAPKGDEDPVPSATVEDTTTSPRPEGPALVCPGDPACPDNDGALRAGAAVRSILPDCWEAWDDADGDATYAADAEPFFDCGCDRRCEGDPGWPGADEGEGDGVFQAVWLAGFQNARPANGVRDASLGLRGDGDGLWATAVVFDQGGTRIGLVAADAFGVMIDDTVALRARAAEAGLDLDHLVLHSSHVHASPDVLGIYGPDRATTGYDPRYATLVTDRVLEALQEAVDGLVEVRLEVGAADAGNGHADGVGNLIVDTRDPVVVDPSVGVAHLIALEGDQTVATLVHFSNHPETTAGDYALMTADFVHALRRTVEDGVDWGDGARPGVGGVAMYLNGTVGGMMTSLGAAGVDPLGVAWPARTFEKADTIGQLLGETALDALAAAEPVADPRIATRRHDLLLPVDNLGFQAMFQLGTLAHRQTYEYDAGQPISDANLPKVASEVGLVELGPLRILCLPGEPLPELAVGGYGGAYVPPNQVLVDPENPNPPDLGAAPEGPFLLERVGGGHAWVLGLANDQIGYVIPEAQFVVHDAAPFLLEADGDHYEETNSLGPRTAPLLLEGVEALLAGWP